MSIKKLTIKGFRGFSEQKIIDFAMPDGEHDGSGLTILVGPNNSGKSSIIEAIYLLSNNIKNIPKPSRNYLNNYNVYIEVVDKDNQKITLKTNDNGGSGVDFFVNEVFQENYDNNLLKTFILSSKRNITSTFNLNYPSDRNNYKSNVGSNGYRPDNIVNNNFGNRLAEIRKNMNLFQQYLKKVLDPVPNWKIESNDNNSSYLEFSFGKTQHGSNGAGDGYINIFNIIDALYDSTDNSVILIDEPEVSLHPDLQKKLLKLFLECSKTKQIIISTHSPYFIDWESVATYAKLIRFKKEEEKINLFELTEETKRRIIQLIEDKNNMHTFGLDANDIFFLQDNLIVTEGQDDVLCYKKIFNNYKFYPTAAFFGWGTGGKFNIYSVLSILNDMGYRKVFVIADSDATEIVEKSKCRFPNYGYYCIQADDVHEKTKNKKILSMQKRLNALSLNSSEKKLINDIINDCFPEKVGLVKSKKDCIVRDEFKDDVDSLIKNINEYFVNYSIMADEIENKKIESVDSNVDENIVDDELAEKLLDSWTKENKIEDYIKNKYKNFNFSGGSVIVSFQKIGDKKYYVIKNIGGMVSNNYKISIDYHLLINIETKKVKIKKRKVVKNTLPVNFLVKVIEKLFY